MPTVWRSVAVASSVFNSLTARFSKSKNEDEDTTSQKPITKSNFEGKAEKYIQNNEQKQVVSKIDATSSERSIFDWLPDADLSSKRKQFLEKGEKSSDKAKKLVISKSSLQHRSRFLVQSLTDALSPGSQLIRLEEVYKHLLLFPQQKTEMCKAGLLRTALRLKLYSYDENVQAQARIVLALIGHHDPPKGNGIRILSIDGGGTRGMISIEVLRQLESKTNKRVYELFDYMCGVSSGAILSLLLGALRYSLDECETLYRKLSNEIFKQSSIYQSIWGTGRLMWSHAYYDTTQWVDVLKKTFGERLLVETNADAGNPKIGIVSAVMNLPHLQAFVFRNYDFPPRILSHYLGSCKYPMWESIRASGAAPGYFEEYCLDEYLHQDGGIMINNTAALGIHEAKLLWPSDSIDCVVSLGSGRYIPTGEPAGTSTSLKTKVMKIIDSATDTEAVHIALNDLLSPDTYFRINPYLTEFLSLDENRAEKLDQMKTDAQMYLRRNEYKFLKLVQVLNQSRGPVKKSKDWLSIQKQLYL
ncbi:LOW QUALITY PROTEIN: calcium-independent phospholipase A2-gamma-like [Uloborus diversus]|uniref:LOW QUALITY PROTEIN: calcium-independent phospholipase A2-gamma-like n=1 Tax=Uloborus diversus TaxID=327109 RepID=UPI0024092377|nr:LOW QUALITY PROTEIN: calcium-independent phospholipase A2-gamma-like [Uloborus diversus]